jgi:hypothetical protein
VKEDISQNPSVSLKSINAAEQSVHLTLGILRTSQAVFYALSFFWLDGFAVPAPAQVTQTVGRMVCAIFPLILSRLANGT